MIEAIVLAALVVPKGPPLQMDCPFAAHGAPVRVTVAPDPDGAPQSLVLMAHDGTVLAEAVGVEPGPVDVTALLPGIHALDRTAWLQLLSDGTPRGSSIVVQPLLSRLLPVTAQATRGNGGATYTRITGWREEAAEDSETLPAVVPANLDRTGATRSGLRLHPDADVTLHTSVGDIRVALRPDAAPNTAWSFRELAGAGFYDGVIFHRVVPMSSNGHPFVIQGGDPTGTGEGGPGFWLPIEPSPMPHDFGVISMARADDPDSAGSQFFFALSREATARLDGQYCAFGEAVAGAETIRAIAGGTLAVVQSGTPEDPVVIREARLVPAPPRTPGAGRPDRPVRPLPQPAPSPGDRVPR